MKASLNLRFSQNLALTPQLQQSIKLLQLSAFELEQELTQTAETNPLIEYEPPIEGATSEPIVELSHRASNNIRSNSEWDEAEDRFSRLSTPESLLDHLMTQIRVMRLSDSEKSLMGFLAGNLDERGFLSIHLDDLRRS